MYFSDLWQFLGSSQVAELTALIGLALCLRPVPHHQSILPILKKVVSIFSRESR